MTENPIRIMSVDDHPLIRQGVAGLVSAQSDLKPSFNGSPENGG
jgi:DNA-binding NarL/FixJ family response regulator